MKKTKKIKNPVASDLMTPKYSLKVIRDKRKKDPRHKKNYKKMDEAVKEYGPEERLKDLYAKHSMHKEKAQQFHRAFEEALKRGGTPKPQLHGLIRSREHHHQEALFTAQKIKELEGDMKKSIGEAYIEPGKKLMKIKSPSGFISRAGEERARKLIGNFGYTVVKDETQHVSSLIEMKLMELAEKTRKIFGDELFEQIDFFDFLQMLEEEMMERKSKTKKEPKEDDEEDEDKENMLKPHVIVQIRKHMDTKNDPEEMLPIKFHDGETNDIALKHMRRANAMYNLLRPAQKEDLGNKLNASHSSFMRAIGAGK